jgi:sulfate transport system substrate-binding protein
VAVVDKVAQKRRTTALANDYLSYLYTPEAQDLIGRNYYRPRDPKVAKRYSGQFKSLKLFTIDLFGGWRRAQSDHFTDGGIFDQIYRSVR